MPTAKVYNLEGKETGSIKLDDSVFGLPENGDLLRQIYVSLTGNRRQVIAHTKTRGERSGSGIKPWRQKGTGRARVGSVRTPVWRKGGIVFGPTKERNFSKKINKKMNAKGLVMAISGKIRDKELTIIEKMELKEKKTKEMAKALKKLKLKGSVLISLSDSEREVQMAIRNLPKVKNILTKQLNVLDILNKKNLLLSRESVKYLEKKYKE